MRSIELHDDGIPDENVGVSIGGVAHREDVGDVVAAGVEAGDLDVADDPVVAANGEDATGLEGGVGFGAGLENGKAVEFVG